MYYLYFLPIRSVSFGGEVRHAYVKETESVLWVTVYGPDCYYHR